MSLWVLIESPDSNLAGQAVVKRLLDRVKKTTNGTLMVSVHFPERACRRKSDIHPN
jgi:hypothetical protein